MAKKHISKSNAQLCREYRARKKALLVKDEIDKQLDAYIFELKTKEKEDKTKKNPIDFNNWDADWLEPKSNLRKQFQVSEPPHYSLWGELEGTQNPLDKVSHQQNLRNIFGNRAE
jgi:hypothetical protein